MHDHWIDLADQSPLLHPPLIAVTIEELAYLFRHVPAKRSTQLLVPFNRLLLFLPMIQPFPERN